MFTNHISYQCKCLLRVPAGEVEWSESDWHKGQAHDLCLLAPFPLLAWYFNSFSYKPISYSCTKQCISHVLCLLDHLRHL